MFVIQCKHPGCSARAFDPSELWFEAADGKTFCGAHVPLPDEDAARGFGEPEDGAEQRYRERAASRPWVAHAVWWWVHNVIAHPLIGIAPLRSAFRFHDWTSRKMHGR